MRLSKSKKYAVEQFLIQKEIISLLSLECGFYLYEIDNDLKKQQQILDLVPDIWKFFAHMNVTGLLYPKKCKRAWLSIVRGVLKNRYYLKYKACRHLSEKGSVFTMKYYISPKNSAKMEVDSEVNGGEVNGEKMNGGDSLSNSKIVLKLQRKQPKPTLQYQRMIPNNDLMYQNLQKQKPSDQKKTGYYL